MRRNEPDDNKVRRALPIVHPNAAAIDVGARMHVAAVGADRTAEPVRSFGTFTTDLHRLVDWFAECRVETVVMESTSIYWIPIFELLEARGFEVFLVNARDAKHVPGRKTDVSDAQWLQRLHSYGLLRTSFRPKGEIVELRAYLRQRERLLEYAASHIQHMQKALTEMNLQLHHVVADITGATGLRIIRAILAGERDPAMLAELRDTRCHASVETITKALTGNYRAEHLFALEQALALYDAYQEKASACDARIEAVLKQLSFRRGREVGPLPSARRGMRRQPNGPGFDVRAALFALLGKDLTQINGLGPYLALKLIAECGDDLSAWPSAKHQALYLLALPRAEQQDLRWQGALLAHAPLGEPGRGAPEARCSDDGSNRHRPGGLLPAALRTYRQGQGDHRDRPQDRCSLLQRRASRNGLRRPWRVLLRDPLSRASHRQFASARQGLRLRPPTNGAGSRFLGKPRPTSRRNRREVRFHCEAPGDLAGAMVVRGARCLAGWVLCLADTTAQSAQPE
jgi:transposase